MAKATSYKGSARQKVWTHNSFLGYAKMGQVHMWEILASTTATPEAKALASSIRASLGRLDTALRKERL